MMEEQKSLEDKMFEAIRIALWNTPISEARIAAKSCALIALMSNKHALIEASGALEIINEMVENISQEITSLKFEE
jgi:hypothetical protein